MALKNGLKEDLLEAITSQNWSLILDIYEFLFNEKIDYIPSDTDGQITKIDTSKKENEIDINSLGQEIPETTQFVTGHSSEDDMPGYKENFLEKQAQITYKARQIRSNRLPYQPNIIKCVKCHIEFDYNKEYPVGRMSENPQPLCNKCQIR